MPRNIDATFAALLRTGIVKPFFLAVITFRSSTQYVWTGVGDLVFGGNTHKGVGAFGSVGTIAEGVEVRADGTTITLSGIDPTLFADCMSDIKQGAPAILYFGALDNTGAIVGVPYKIFAGIVDTPEITQGGESISITLALETLMVDGQRASNDRYTSASQRIKYPTDSAFSWVEQLNDLALSWGQ